MKRKITLSIALALSIVLLSLMSSDSTAKAEPPQRFRADTGLVTLGPNQVLRMAIAGDFNGDGDVGGADLIFRRIGYIEQDNIYGVASQDTTDPIRLRSGEGASIDINPGQFDAVRGVVAGNYIGTNLRGARVTVQIIDGDTGEVESLMALLVP